jgi:hypothetical protein
MTIDDSVLLHNDCNRLLRRNSQQNLVNEVMYKLFNCKAREKENKENKEINENKKDFIEILLSIFCCHFEN